MSKESQNAYWDENYKGQHIALLRDKSHYSAYINKQILHGWKIQTLESGQRLLRQAIDAQAASDA